jgi:sugar phosphate isomerase/epimerase
MKIGVLIGIRRETDIEEEFKKVSSLELNCCQVCIWDTAVYTDENAERIRSAAEKYSIEVSALWAGWSGPTEWNFVYGPSTLGLVPAAYRSSRLQELLQGAAFAKKIGTANMATHVGFLPEVPSDPDFVGTVGALKKLAGEMQKDGLTFLFETGQETPVTMLRAIEMIGLDNVGINLDTANLILYGKANTADAVDVFGKYVKNTHCKDGEYPTKSMELGEEKPLGQGRANMPLVAKKLAALGYTGPYIIEREISGSKQIEDIVSARDFLREILAEL